MRYHANLAYGGLVPPAEKLLPSSQRRLNLVVMRFCLTSTQADWGGGERLLWSIRTALLVRGHHVSWIVRRDQPLHRLVVAEGDDVVATPERRGVNPREWFEVRHGLRQWAPDVLLLNDSHAIMLGGSAALACSPVRPLRLAIRHVVFRLRSPLKLRLMSDAVICVSEAARRSLLAAGIPRERTEVIYGGCAPPTLDPLARQWAEGELGITPTAPLLVCVGNLLECKGHVPLVEAAALVHAQMPDAHIVIAGEGVLRERLQRRIEELGLNSCVHLLGFRNDADRWISAASVVLHPSLQEGLSLVLIQAQMLGKLIVSTGVGGSAEVLGLDEDLPCLAWLATPGDPTTLAEQIKLATDAWRLGPAAYAIPLERAASRARLKFDIDRNVGELIELAHRLRQPKRKSLV